MEKFFYFSGIVLWVIITPCLLFFLLFCLSYWLQFVFLPSFGNLLFIMFGYKKRAILPLQRNYNKSSYYEIWDNLKYGEYYYYAKSHGRNYFGFCTMKKLIRKARKESLRVKEAHQRRMNKN